MQNETEHSALSANEFYLKSDEIAPKHKQQNPDDFLIVTKIRQNIYKFQWIIRQFSALSKNKALYSTDIHASDTSRYRLNLIKYEHGFGLFHERQTTDLSNKTRTEKNQRSVPQPSTVFSSEASNFTSGYVTSSTVSVRDDTVEAQDAEEFTGMLEYQVSATDSRGKEFTKWTACFLDDGGYQSYKIGEYMNNALKYFPDDSLILDCNLKVILTPDTEKIPIAFEPSLDSNGWKKLSVDFKTLYQSSLDTDVSLVAGTEKIRAHKLILAARSTVFRKIFQHDMKEAEQNSVTITDVEFSALQRLVEFLYAGVITEEESKSMNLQELFDLYYAADKYQVMDLREMVGNTLLGRIRMDNAGEILVWADRHNDKDLKFRIMNFIRQNFEVVSNTEAWESCALHYPALAVEVFSFCFKKK